VDSKSLIQRDLAHVWHPCTQMQDHEWLPLVPIRAGKGAWLEDFDGKRYLDAVSSWWVNLFGHCHPHISGAIKQQADQLEHVLLAGFTHEPVVELSERLANLAPAGLTRCFYADNGSSAVEVALKMSFHYWKNLGRGKKTKFICLSNSYHGETLGALAVGDVALYKKTYSPLLMQAITVPSPDCYGRDASESWEAHSRAMFQHMEQALVQHAREACAVIIEPLVQCAGNMRMYHPVYLQLLREACDRHDVHLIVDEIATGFGRTGTLFASEQAPAIQRAGEAARPFSPDFMLLSKGLTGGFLPLAVVMTTENIYQAFYADYASLKAFLHSHSYTGNPLACRAALATLDLFKASDVLGNNQLLVRSMAKAVEDLQDHPHVAEIRQTGMVLAIEMAPDKSRLSAYPWQQRRGLKVYQHALSRGVLLRPLGNVVYFMPPYVINEEEIGLMAQVAAEGIHIATADSPA
jgi:adenosylmethionine---8-amino-7-oxononanoate aminotransferase